MKGAAQPRPHLCAKALEQRLTQLRFERAELLHRQITMQKQALVSYVDCCAPTARY